MPASTRRFAVAALTAVLTLGTVPVAVAQPADSTSARSEEGRSARGLYVPGLEGGLPGLVEGGGDGTLSRRQTLVEAARTSGLTEDSDGADPEAEDLSLVDEAVAASGASDVTDSEEMAELSDEIARQADLRAQRAQRLASEAAERARREAEERARREAEERARREAEREAREAREAARRATAAKAVDTALAQVGVPYRWGGSTPRGFDCSGLMLYAWRAAGVDLPRTSRAQYRGTTRVSTSNLKPGDLLFFYSPISHVGMYIGNGKMVDAPSSGRTVRVRSVYWSSFVGAGRPDY